MKVLKSLTAILLTTFVSTSLVTAQVAEKTLVKSFNLKGDKVLLLDLEGDVDVQHIKSELVRVQINLELENGSPAMLKSLIVAGRYNLKSTNEGGEMTIVSPGMKKEVKIRGKKLIEKISYTIFAPDDILVKIADESSTNLEEGKKEPASL